MTDDLMMQQQNSILIADASRSNRVMLRKWLVRSGYECHTVETGRQALDALREFPAQVLLLDMKFPDIEGWQVIRMVKRQPLGHRPLIIAVTACAMPGDEARFMNWGCDAYLAKPVDLHRLSEVIEQLVASGDLQPQIA
ncbi:MAG: response regulator [Phycisphaeraceae bacterium JB051]